ncbi:MAG TPA: 2Fe-2S iron-sulfur cluster-binding protein [bacterium]|jgi:NADH-quinone oxidoreductase subunit G|nr:2Fe-2S iron-sulfur cluster-binding protein [bacterium]
MPKLTIDGKEIEVPAGTNLIEAAKTMGAEIPHFCYHPGLSVAGNCRMCLVEIEKAPKLQIACNTPVAEGMVVITTSEKVKKARAGVMEFLLLNHPIDCPICDCAGECYLQDYYMDHDLKASRLEEGKTKKQKAQPIGEHVMLDKERCVLCSRCVRFTDEVSKTFELGIFGRGSTEEIGLAPGKVLDNAYSGCVVDLCPVGALTDRDFRFKSRPWFLKETETVCTGCSMGCNVVLDTNTNPYNKVGEARAYRLFPRENKAVNGYWMCDEGRYSHKAIDQGRAQSAALEGRTVPLESALHRLAGIAAPLVKAAPARAAFLLSPQLTNEALFAFKRLAASLGVAQVEVGDDLKAVGKADGYLIQADKNPNSRGAQDLGLAPRAGVLGGSALLASAEAGNFDVLVVVGHVLQPQRLKALGAKVKALVGLQSHAHEGSEAYGVLLPMAVAAEQDGSFTNHQGRVQRNRKALEPLGESQPGYALAQALGHALGSPQAKDTPADLFLGWAKSLPQSAHLTLETLGTQGAASAASAVPA